MKFPPPHLLLPLILYISGLTTNLQAAETTKEAYVTFLQENAAGSVVGVRVLGQSLRETGTKKDCVVVCNRDTVSDATIDLLVADGWVVKFKQEISETLKPKSQQAGSRLLTHSSLPAEKVIAWKMTEYHRLTLIEPNFAVMVNIDRIFDCGSFCASYKSSDGSFDTGVMVIQPSEATYKNMMGKLISSEMMTEDTFLNEYFSRLIYESAFNWSAKGRRSSSLTRLPASFNADATVYYMLNSHWVITDDLKIVCFSAFGLVEPWDWKFYFLFELNWKWNAIRERLPYNIEDNPLYIVSNPLFWGPFLLLLLLYLAGCTCRTFTPTGQRSFTKLLRQYHNRHGNYPTFYSFLFLVLSYFFTFQIMPTTLTPNKAEFALCMWSSSLFLSFLGLYIYAIDSLREINCHAGHISCPSIHARKQQQLMKSTFVLFLPYLATYVLLRAVPGFIHPFVARLISMVILLVIHIFVSCQVGHNIMQLWSQ